MRTKSWLPIAFSLFLIFLVTTEAIASSDTIFVRKNIEKLIKERVDYKYNVGIVVAVIDSNGSRFYNYGNISKEDNAIAVNEETIFPIASITKVFTTLLLAIDIKAGLVKLTDPAQKYLPNNLKLPTYGKRQITLEDLATHTSGLPGFGTTDKSGTYTNYSSEKFYQFISQSNLPYLPGSHYEYSNMIGLLADVVAKTSNSTYKELLEARIFKPLELKDTKIISFPNSNNTHIIGYDATESRGLPERLPFLEASWAMYSNAKDLAKFISANMGLTKTNLYSAMQLTHVPIHSQDGQNIDINFVGPKKLAIGLGWNIDQTHHVIWKNGNIPHYSSFIGFNPETKQGVVVLANTGNVAYTDNLALHILNPQISLLPIYHEVSINKKSISKYAGKYCVSDGTYYEFFNVDNHLKARHISKGKDSDFFNLYPKSKNQFFGRIADAVFTFSHNRHGVISFIVKEDGKQKSAVKVE